MFNCLSCNKGFNSIELYIHHIKTIEGFKPQDCFECSFCASRFLGLSSFKRHLIKCSKKNYENEIMQLFPQEKDISVDLNSTSNDLGDNEKNVNVSDNFVEFSSKVSESISSKNSDSNINVDEIKNEINGFVLQFLCKLNKNYNVTFSLLKIIISDISDYLLANIFKKLLQILKPLINNGIFEKLKKLFDFCSNPFCDIKSQYILKSKLK